MSHAIFRHTYEEIISLENLLSAWKEFSRGKRKRADVLEYESDLMRNLFALNESLRMMAYSHQGYHAFKISDPKPRDIHKATVNDRIVHRALYLHLYPFFDRVFICDSYSCRNEKGTHRALRRFEEMARWVSLNHSRTVWVLKCDTRKFFASIDHEILMRILSERISDVTVVWLLGKIIESYKELDYRVRPDNDSRGLPLGNLTSQIFANVFMNEFDQFVKHHLHAKYFIRYADDFVLMHEDRQMLDVWLPVIAEFLQSQLLLELHPRKVEIRTVASGVDFLGWVHFPDHRVLRTVTKKRMFRNVSSDSSRASYLGMLSHGNGMRLQTQLLFMDPRPAAHTSERRRAR